MNIVVTGAAGFLGGNLVRELLHQGHTVRAVIRKRTSGIDGLPVETVKGDIRDLESLHRAFSGMDAIFHCAAVVSIQGSLGGLVEEVNIGGVENVVEAALKSDAQKLIHFSSVHSFDPSPHDEPITEGRALCDANPHHPAYARSKANGERAIRMGVERGLKACILNPSGMIGPFDFAPTPLGEALIQMRDRAIPGLVAGGYNWVDVRDVVNSAINALERGKVGEGYLVTGHSTTVRELAEVAERVTGSAPPWLTSPLWLAKATAPLLGGLAKMMGNPPLYTSESLQVLGDNSDFDHSKATREIGHTPRPLLDTLTDSYQWLKSVDM